MTRKNKKTKAGVASTRIAALENSMKKMKVSREPKQKKKTPFGDVGSTLGGAVGSIFGSSKIGNDVGRWLGSGIGSIFGSGDYLTTNQPADYNIFSGQTPKFDSTRATNVVCHREFITNITGTTNFANQSYPIQPGSALTFPWLNSIAGAYQEYRIHGLVFEFNPLITDFVTSGAPGVVVMATNYNADQAAYTSKVQMENSEFATAVKPTQKLIHMIECSMDQTPYRQRYVRTGTTPTNQDLRLYDWGNFQIATQGNPTQLLGELWVTYCVEFFKPILPTSNDVGSSDHFVRSSAGGGTVFGDTVVATPVNFIGSSITASNVLSIPPGPAQYYLINVAHTGSAAAWTGVGTPTVTNGSLVAAWNNGASSNYFAPSAATTSAVSFSWVVLANSAQTVTFTTGASVSCPINSKIDIVVTSLGLVYS